MKGFRYLVCIMLLLMTAAVAGAETKIRIAGSGGMIPLVKDLSAAFMAQNKTVSIELNQKSIESTGGIRSAAEGRIDIGMSARGLKEDERNLGVQMFEIARVATVVGINSGVALRDISSSQLCRIFEGKIVNWQELGSGNNPILALTRPDNDATKESVRKNLACYRSLKEASSVVNISTAPEMAKILAGRPNAIGFTDAVAVDGSNGSIIPVSIDGVAPSPENVKNGRYKIIKGYFLVTKGQPSGAAKEFIDFVKGPKGVKITEGHKAVAIK